MTIDTVIHADLDGARGTSGPSEAEHHPGGYTVLRTTKPINKATKMWRYNLTIGEWTKVSYQGGMFFTVREEVANNLHEMAESRRRISRDPRSLILRSALHPKIREELQYSPGLQIRRQKYSGGEPTFAKPLLEVARCWMEVDIDKFPLRTVDDLIDDPEGAIENAVAEILPDCFQGVEAFWQLSSSAGFVPGILKCHLAYWLDKPIETSALKALMMQIAPKADEKMYDSVRVHYIAAPIIEGGHDPIPRRFGWLKGLNEAVSLPPFDPTIVPKPGPKGGGGYKRQASVESILEELGDGEGLNGFHGPLLGATWRYAYEVMRHGGRDDEAFKERLVDAIRQAHMGPSRPRSDLERYSSDRYLQTNIDGAIQKLSNGRFGIQHGESHEKIPEPTHTVATDTPESARGKMLIVLADVIAKFITWNETPEDARGKPDHIGLRAEVGLGKSKTIRQLLRGFIETLMAGKKPYRVLFLCPTHKLGREALEDFRSLGISAAVWAGREYVDPETEEPMCLDLEAVNDAISVGADIEKNVCADREGNQCPFYSECRYQKQKPVAGAADVVIAAHQTAFNNLPKEISHDLAVTIIDESWWQPALKPNREVRLVSYADSVLKHPCLRDESLEHGRGKKRKSRPIWVIDHEATKTLHNIALKAEYGFQPDTPIVIGEADELLPKTGDLIRRQNVEWAGSTEGTRKAGIKDNFLTAEECREAAALEWKRKKEIGIFPGMGKKARKEATEAAANNGILARRHGVWIALAELLEGKDEYSGRLQLGERCDDLGYDPTILLHTILDFTDAILERPILMLDAALKTEINREWLPRFALVGDISAKAENMIVNQVCGRAFGRGGLVPSRKSDPKKSKQAAASLDELRDFCQLQLMTAAAEGKNPTGLVITYEDAKYAFQNIPGLATGHFNSLRGIDAHKDVGTLFVIGRPLPEFTEHRAMAMALTGKPLPEERPKPVLQGVTMADGSRRAIQTQAYTDPTLEMVRKAITDAEVADCIGRGRGVNRSDIDVLVWILADVVVPIPVTRLIPWHDVDLSNWNRMAARGCVLTNEADMRAGYPDLWTSIDAAKKARQRLEKGGRFGTSLCEYSLTKQCPEPRPFSRVRYQLPGPGRKPSIAYLPTHLIPSARDILEELLGTVVRCEPMPQDTHTNHRL